MKKYYIQGILAFMLLIHGLPGQAQQNIQLTQYIFNTMSVNPAYAGYKEQWFAQMALRKQWAGMDDAPTTGQFSIDGILDPEKKRTAVGLQLGADRLGPQSTTSAYVNYAYRLQLNDEDTRRIAFGIGAGVSQYTIDYSRLTPIESGDAFTNPDVSSSLVPDFRVGVYYYSPKFYVGASVMDLLSNNAKQRGNSSDLLQGTISHKRHLYFVSGFLFDVNNSLKIRPSILLKEDFMGPSSVDLNTMMIFNSKVWIGASYRSSMKLFKKDYQQGDGVRSANSIAGIAQFFVNENFRIGYSYDSTLSSLRTIESGSHELTLGLTLPGKGIKVFSPRFF